MMTGEASETSDRSRDVAGLSEVGRFTRDTKPPKAVRIFRFNILATEPSGKVHIRR